MKAEATKPTGTVSESETWLLSLSLGVLFCVLMLGCLSGMPVAERAVLQEQLIDIILEVLKRNPQLHYYQGYHDVAVSLLLVVGERMAIAMLDTLSNVHLRLQIFLLSNPFIWRFQLTLVCSHFLMSLIN